MPFYNPKITQHNTTLFNEGETLDTDKILINSWPSEKKNLIKLTHGRWKMLTLGRCLHSEDAYPGKMLTLGRCLPLEDAYLPKILTLGTVGSILDGLIVVAKGVTGPFIITLPR